MFDPNTVLIVGAGASVEHGLPSGMQVFKSLYNYCLKYREIKGRMHPYERMVMIYNEHPSFFHLAIIGIFSRLEKNEKQEFFKCLNNLSLIIDKQPNYSIDEFLYSNKSYYTFGKLFSALTIVSAKYEIGTDPIDGDIDLFRSVEYGGLFSNSGYPSWIAAFFQKITAHNESGKQNSVGEDSKINVITFNYDTLFEDALNNYFRNTEAFKDRSYLDYLNIYHINGMLRPTPEKARVYYHEYVGDIETTSDLYEIIIECRDNIFMIKEEVSDDVEQDRLKAREAIKQADKIYSLGFDYDPRNVELIHLDQKQSVPRHSEYFQRNSGVVAAELFALNFDGNIRLAERIRRLRGRKALIDGSSGAHVGCSEACMLGFFDQ